MPDPIFIPSAPINQFEEYSDPIAGDWLAIFDMRTGKTKKIDSKFYGQSTPSTNYKWSSTFNYPVNAIVDHSGGWYKSLQTPNLGQNPTSTPLFWSEQVKAASGLLFWVAGVYTGDPVVVLKTIGGITSFYILNNPTRPFSSSNFDAELTLGDWKILGGLAGTDHYKGAFVSAAALSAAFPTALAGNYALVDTAGPAAALYIWDNTDSVWVASGTATVVPDATESVKGKLELSDQAETNVGVNDTTAVTPLKAKVKNRLSSAPVVNTLLAQTDDQKVIFSNSAAAVVYTFPVLEAGTYLTIVQVNNGNITWAASGTAFVGNVTALPGGVLGLAVTFYYRTTTSILVIAGNITSLISLAINGTLAIRAGESAGVIAKVGGVIFTDITTIGNILTGDDTLFTYSVPALTLRTDKDTLRATCAGTFAATGNNKRLRVKFGATAIFDSGALAIVALTSWVLEIEITRTGSSAEKCNVKLTTSSSVLPAMASYALAVENTSFAIALAVTAEATATNDIVGEMFKVEWLPHE